MDVQPGNPVERGFTILVVIFALVAFSYVVGSITGGLAQLRALHEEASKLFWNLRRFLKQNRVPVELKTRVQRYLEHAWHNRHKKVQSVRNVPVFVLLSDQLTNELQATIFMPHMSIHPLFKRLLEISNITMHRMANAAISTRMLARKDSMFERNERATHMYLVAAGRLQYLRLDSQAIPHHEIVTHDEDWIAEHVLWAQDWFHIGTLKALTESNMLSVNPHQFRDIMCLNPDSKSLGITYGKNFMQWINSEDHDSWSDIIQGDEVSDRHEAFMEIEDPEYHRQPEKTINGNSFMRPYTMSVSGAFRRMGSRNLSGGPHWGGSGASEGDERSKSHSVGSRTPPEITSGGD